MYCSKCGTEVGEDARYCPNCGAEIETQNECLQEIVNIENNKKEQDKKQSTKDILVLIVTLLGIVVLIMLLSGLSNNDVVIEKMGNIEKSAEDWLNKPDKPWNNSWQKSIDTYKPGGYFDEQHDLVYNYYDDKYGLHDLQDNIVIPCEYDNIWFESELSLIMAEKEGGRATDIYSRDGEKVLSVDGTVRPDFCTECLVGYIENIPNLSTEEWNEWLISGSGEVKLINLQGELIEQRVVCLAQYENVYEVCTKNICFDDMEWTDEEYFGRYIMNAQGERISDIFPVMNHYDEINHIFQVKSEEGDIYYINEKGETLFHTQEQWQYYLGFVNGRFKVSIMENDIQYVGIAQMMTPYANMVIEAKYQDIHGENGVYWASEYVGEELRYALFDGSGKQITDFIYDEISLIYDENGEFVDHIEARKESGVSDIYYLKSGIAYHICKLQEEKYIDIWKIKGQYYYIMQGSQDTTGFSTVKIFDQSENILLNQQVQWFDSEDGNEDNGLLVLRYDEEGIKENVYIFDVVSGKEIRVLKDVAYFKMVKNGVCYYDGNTKEYIVEEILKNDKTQSVTWKKLLETKKPVTVEDDVYSIKIQEQSAHYVGN